MTLKYIPTKNSNKNNKHISVIIMSIMLIMIKAKVNRDTKGIFKKTIMTTMKSKSQYKKSRQLINKDILTSHGQPYRDFPLNFTNAGYVTGNNLHDIVRTGENDFTNTLPCNQQRHLEIINKPHLWFHQRGKMTHP